MTTVTPERGEGLTDEKALIEIVEGLKGSIEHGTWRDDSGSRLKDTAEWVAFYLAHIRPAPSPVTDEVVEVLRDLLAGKRGAWDRARSLLAKMEVRG